MCSVVIVAFLLSAGAVIEANTVKATETTVSSSNLKTDAENTEKETVPSSATNNNSVDVMDSLMKATNQEDKDLNKYLFGLTYNKIDILTRKGETIENYSNTSAKQQGNEFIVVEKVKKSLSNKSEDVSINGNSDIFLGALFKANQDLKHSL